MGATKTAPSQKSGACLCKRRAIAPPIDSPYRYLFFPILSLCPVFIQEDFSNRILFMVSKCVFGWGRKHKEEVLSYHKWLRNNYNSRWLYHQRKIWGQQVQTIFHGLQSQSRKPHILPLPVSSQYLMSIQKSPYHSNFPFPGKEKVNKNWKLGGAETVPFMKMLHSMAYPWSMKIKAPGSRFAGRHLHVKSFKPREFNINSCVISRVSVMFLTIQTLPIKKPEKKNHHAKWTNLFILHMITHLTRLQKKNQKRKNQNEKRD